MEQLRAEALAELREVYRADDTPWIIGYSGGKDSNAVLQLAYTMLLGLRPEERHKSIYVVASDTLVESPVVEAYLNRSLVLLAEGARSHGLPLAVARVVPSISETFWVLLLGKGYPSPNRFFRWCTDRLKIAPATRYIESQIRDCGSVVILLGARRAESSSRAQVLENRRIKGSRFRRHATMNRAYVYTPISEWQTHDVWHMLTLYEAPWNVEARQNRQLRGLYRDASGGECPLVIDKSTPSCGQSRFGCWTCTVVTNDESMEGLIETGGEYERMRPLLDYRNQLKLFRDDPAKRESWRRSDRYRPRGWEVEQPVGSDSEAEQENGVLGPFRLETRKELLRGLLEVQKTTGYRLIRADEMALIQQHWTADYRDRPDAVAAIAREVYGDQALSAVPGGLRPSERALLTRICERHGVDILLLDRLLDLERGYIGRIRRRGLFEGISEEISDWANAAARARE